MPAKALLRDEIWRIEERTDASGQTLFRLRSDETGKVLEVVSPPDQVEILPSGPLELDRRALSPFALWHQRYEIIRIVGASRNDGGIQAGRVRLEPYQLVPARRLLTGPSRSLLIADDVGLGKTIEAGLCILELLARQVATRVLLVVPPGLVDQWVEEMQRKFGLAFQVIADSASLDAAQTALAEGISPWAFHDRVVTSIEYLKRSGVYPAALRKPWDVIVVDEAHYLAESGSPANPYSTRRTRLGTELRKATRSLILLTATPHNGYRHSFRSLIELVEPTHATFEGDEPVLRRRVARAMVRRLKQQITRKAPDGTRVPAFMHRAPVQRLDVPSPTDEERAIFEKVSAYCARTTAAAAGTERSDLVSFAMQIVKKRMLSTRLALARTVEARLDALKEPCDEPEPPRSELREMQSDLPMPDEEAERLAARVLRASVPQDQRRRTAEQRQLKELQRRLDRLAERPDPKIVRLLGELRSTVLGAPDERAIVFTEYRDSLEAVRQALQADPDFAGRFAELPGGLTARQRRERIARFAEPDCLVLLATDAASEGLNLQRHCRRLYHLELPWNPNRLEQRNGRIDRYGQQRTTHIGYLFYTDSPEDRVLDRLVQRIAKMQDDRVSTPDILGMIETTRIPERLLAIENELDEERETASLNRVLDEERTRFAGELAPLLFVGEGSPDWMDATSADSRLEDDVELERAMLRTLSEHARPCAAPHEYRIQVPPNLRGPGVKDRYDPATFRRSVALEEAAEATEFIHRLHTLVRAAARHAREVLSVPAPNSLTLPPYLAVRRLASLLDGPAAVFTFLDRSAHPDGTLLAVGVSVTGEVLGEATVAAALAPSERPGDVPWDACARAFSGTFPDLRSRAEEAAKRRIHEAVEAERRRRSAMAETLRAEVAAYRGDRLREIAREEAAERAGTREQGELFREVRTDWEARRAGVATQAEARLARIAEWVEEPAPAPPEALGILLVFPGAVP